MEVARSPSSGSALRTAGGQLASSSSAPMLRRSYERPPEPVDLKNPSMFTLKDFITARCKGGVGVTSAPYMYITERQRAIAGRDSADQGGSYSSYSLMQQHRMRHVRLKDGPEDRFGVKVPLTSQLHGLGPQPLRPPTYPMSSSDVTRVGCEIARATNGSKNR
eukprot:TRINITY_DN44842_c0_g1_i1.p1 TRINITY_DN44842_c0_g1~~TRINITY_DN44842_c0_g1_i1.p1  ORF type:complete len:170 (-),score=22.06 TRINITY_DN44842_c0_g1_i1:24-512(-)